jgi:hypothetical protein
MNVLQRMLRASANLVLRVVGLALIGLSLLFAILVLTQAPGHFLQRDSNLIGAGSMLMLIASTGLWGSHRLYLLWRRAEIPFRDLPRRLFLFLRRQHTFLGWVVFATASSHGLYFLLVDSLTVSRMISGLAAWVVLATLAGLGWWIEQGRKRKRSGKTVQWWHTILAAIFLVALFLHIVGPFFGLPL